MPAKDKQTLPHTPSQTVGPFFHYAMIRPEENILTNKETKGHKISLTGTIYDGDGEPIPDAMIEIWQADANGIFKHESDPKHKNADPNFKGFGRAETVKNGHYFFETVKPAKSALDDDTQSPYIRLRVFARGMLTHATTRLYFSDEDNSNDPILNSLSKERQSTLIATLEPPHTYRFDIRVQGDKETVFFDS